MMMNDPSRSPDTPRSQTPEGGFLLWGISDALTMENKDKKLERKIRKSMMDAQSESDVIPRDFLCCKLCEEEYKQPKYLLCLHSFCSSCLQKHINKTLNERFFWCPICGTEMEVESADMSSLPDNILACRLSNPVTVGNKQESLCKFCKNGGNFIDASFFCLDCEDFLCTACNETHMEQEDFLGHTSEDRDEHDQRLANMQEGTNDGKHVLPRCCHYYDPLDIGAMFCVDCDTAVCADCHLSYHEEHRCAEMVAVAENFQTRIKDPIDELKNDNDSLQDALTKLKQSELDTINQQKEMHHLVKSRKKFLEALIHEYENVLLEEIDKRHAQHLDDIHERRNEIQMHLAAIEGVNDFTDKLLTYGSFEEKVLMRKKVGKRVRELCEEPLLTDPMKPVSMSLTEPNVTVETICNMFGELSEVTPSQSNADMSTAANDALNVDSGNVSDTAESAEQNGVSRFNSVETEMSMSAASESMLMVSNTSDTMRNVKFSETVSETEFEAENCFTLDNPKREITLPPTIQQECLKGIGINQNGDLIVGASSATYQMVYVLEKRGIIRGQTPIQGGWKVHSVASDGKVALVIARGDNRYKVRIIKSDGTGHILTDTQIENYGLSFVTADSQGNLIVASSRYPHVTNFRKTAKPGGCISTYRPDGQLTRSITNEDYQDLGLYLLEKPHNMAVDNRTGSFYVADPGSHNITGFDSSGELIFEYGNSDTEAPLFDGPDLVCADARGNILAADKREGRIDLLNDRGHLKKSFFTEDVIKFLAITPDKLMMVATAEGNIKFYEYLT